MLSQLKVFFDPSKCDSYDAAYYYITKPIAQRLSDLFFHRFHPNTVSVFSYISVAMACFYAWCYQFNTITHPEIFIVFAFCGTSYVILDSVDGIVARRNKTSSETGACFDHSLDSFTGTLYSLVVMIPDFYFFYGDERTRILFYLYNMMFFYSQFIYAFYPGSQVIQGFRGFGIDCVHYINAFFLCVRAWLTWNRIDASSFVYMIQWIPYVMIPLVLSVMYITFVRTYHTLLKKRTAVMVLALYHLLLYKLFMMRLDFIHDLLFSLSLLTMFTFCLYSVKSSSHFVAHYKEITFGIICFLLYLLYAHVWDGSLLFIALALVHIAFAHMFVTTNV